MPTLTITKQYATGSVLTEAHLDSIKDSIETFINTTKLDADNIQDLAATTGSFAANSADKDKMNSDTVDDSTLQHVAGVMSIKDDGITTAKIPDDSITHVKYNTRGTSGSAGDFVQASSSGDITITTDIQVTNQDVTLTLANRAVFIVCNGASGSSSVGCDQTSNTTQVDGKYHILRDSTGISTFDLISGTDNSNAREIRIPTSSFAFIDVPGSTSSTLYKLNADVVGSDRCLVTTMQMSVHED